MNLRPAQEEVHAFFAADYPESSEVGGFLHTSLWMDLEPAGEKVHSFYAT